jgi:hypothetical protein
MAKQEVDLTNWSKFNSCHVLKGGSFYFDLAHQLQNMFLHSIVLSLTWKERKDLEALRGSYMTILGL